jgi:pimeloyl-ACP methyl ester carboxylesterase
MKHMGKLVAIACARALTACQGDDSSLAVDIRHVDAAACDVAPIGVESSDFYIDITTSNMPDPALNGLPAKLRVHRVRPVYAAGSCPSGSGDAIVMIAGGTGLGSTAYDLRMPPTAADPAGGRLSLQETMARAGIDTFAPDLLGYGLSSRLVLDEPCSASLPGFQTDGSCANSQNLCDTGRQFFPVNLQAVPTQASPVGLGIHPGPAGLSGDPSAPLCDHSSRKYFANTDVFADNIIAVINAAIEKARPSDGKVVLLGYSASGIYVGHTLSRWGGANNKVRRVVFMDVNFRYIWKGPNQPAPILQELPTREEDNLTDIAVTFPLTLDPLGGPWASLRSVPATQPSRESICDPVDPNDPNDTTRVPAGAAAALEAQTRALDPLGASWGGTGPTPSGLRRSPTFSRYGWNSEVAGALTIPTLVLQAADDGNVPKVASETTYAALTQVANKVLLQVECGSHNAYFESCGRGAACADEDPLTTPYGQPLESQSWEGPRRTFAAALIEWVKSGAINGQPNGQYCVNATGVIGSGLCP